MAERKDDCEALVNAMLPFAQQMLERHGEFYPFGGAMKTDGEIVAVGTYDGNETPSSIELIEQMKEAFVAGARSEQYKATALVYSVALSLPNGASSDAVAVALDHRADYSVVVLFPYRLDRGELTIEAPLLQPGDAAIFQGTT